MFVLRGLLGASEAPRRASRRVAVLGMPPLALGVECGPVKGRDCHDRSPYVRRCRRVVPDRLGGGRALEAVVYIVGATELLSLITVSQKYVTGDDRSGMAALGRLVMAARDWAGHAVLDAAVFTLGALVLNAAFYRSGLVPRWLSLWGLAGAATYLTAGLLVMYGLEPLSTPQVILEAPLGVQEIILAVWLIVRGFTTLGKSDRLPVAPREDTPGASTTSGGTQTLGKLRV